jgi:hypothetical protein
LEIKSIINMINITITPPIAKAEAHGIAAPDVRR